MKRLVLLSLVLGISVGCNHVTTRVPGVLDMRTDGSEASTADAKAPAGARSGFDSFLQGEGVQAAGSQVKVEDRKFWVLRLINISNESATEELQAALGDKGAMRNLSIGDRYGGMDIVITFVLGIIPCGSFVAMPFSATFEGTRIAAAGGGAPAGEPPAPVPTEGGGAQ